MTKRNNTTPILVEHQFDGKVINLRDEDGYVSATAMCNAVGKKIAQYKLNDTTQQYLDALSADVGIPTSALIQTLKGGNDKNIQGTWVHPKVAIHLAQWLSPEFSVQVTNWVYDWMNKDSDSASGHSPLPSSATPIMYQGKIILMIHQQRGDFVSMRSLCDVTQLDYTRCVRNLNRDVYNYREITQDGENVLCLSYQSAVEWLENIKPVHVQIKKRHILIEAMLHVPKLLKKARDAYRQIVKEVKLIPHTCEDMAPLLEQLEKLAGKRLAIVPLDKLMETNGKFESAVRNSFMSSQGLMHELLKEGENVFSLRNAS